MSANRLKNIQEYYFSTKLRELEQLKAQGHSIINLGIGSPDLPPPLSVRKKLAEYALKDTEHQYQSYRGRIELRKAIAYFYKKHYEVNQNPEDEILPLIGSKEGILHLSMALLNEGDKVLVPNPGYMSYRSVSLMAGAIPINYSLNEENSFLPDLHTLEQQDLSEVKIMWVNYPNMPTGAQANMKIFKKLIDFGRRHQILIVNDNPYSLILSSKPQSILQIKGADEVAVELNSLSKSHNMAGWRIGMLLGNKSVIKQVIKFKSQMDSGMYAGLQMAAVEALKIDNQWFENINRIYANRKKLVLEICKTLNLSVKNEQAGLFVWAKLPDNIHSEKFCNQLLAEKKIFITPGYIFGSNGKHFVRLSLTNDEKILTETINRLTT